MNYGHLKIAMTHRKLTGILAFVGVVLSATPSFAFGAAGCNILPEHDRAISTIENGAYSCGMSMEEANQILGRTDQAAPRQPRRKHHHQSR